MIWFMAGAIVGALLSGLCNAAATGSGVRAKQDDDGDELAEWGSAYPRVDA